MSRTLGRLIPCLIAVTVAYPTVAGNRTFAQTTSGTWTHFPPQQPTYKVAVRPPIKADGSSAFNVGDVIPVKFKLATGTSVFLFDSVWSNNNPPDGEGISDDNFAFLSFTPAAPTMFSAITNLSADYSFALGNCQGGSLRWSVTFDIGNDDGTPWDPDSGLPNPRDNDRSVFIYYGGYPNFTDCTTGPNNQSGVNMIGLGDLRYDTSQLVGGTFYDTYANALALSGSLTIAQVTLALDSGWMQELVGDQLVYKDQSVTLTRAAVNDNAFVPVVSAPSDTCVLPTASIAVVEETNGTVPDPISAQQKFSDTFFGNTNQCTYSYNLDTNSLFGPGNYSVFVVINSQAVLIPGRFKLQ
jgi:hypothetical protein